MLPMLKSVGRILGPKGLMPNAKVGTACTHDKIEAIIKDLKLKVETSIMDDQVRVSGKKLDELQGVIQYLRQSDFEVPLQFVNMKS